MYFDPAPKTRREDLYDFEEELRAFMEAINGSDRLILVTGLRRTGKTSLVFTGLNTCGAVYAYLDGSKFFGRSVISRRDFITMLQAELNDLIKNLGWRKRIKEILSNVNGVEISSSGIKLTWGRRPSEAVDIGYLLKSFGDSAAEDGKKFVFVLDEAQEFGKLGGYNLLGELHFLYERAENVKVVVTGSQFGFLHRFLKLNDPNSPLYGRMYAEVKMGRLDKRKSLEFLRKGFEQLGWMPDDEILEEAVNNVDGIIGWLVFIGYEAKKHGKLDKRLLKEILDNAAKLAARELENFLMYRSEARDRYLAILAMLAKSPSRWSEIKNRLETLKGESISPKVVSNLLKNLQDANIIRKTDEVYEISDPLLKHAINKIILRKSFGKESTTKLRRRSLSV